MSFPLNPNCWAHESYSAKSLSNLSRGSQSQESPSCCCLMNPEFSELFHYIVPHVRDDQIDSDFIAVWVHWWCWRRFHACNLSPVLQVEAQHRSKQMSRLGFRTKKDDTKTNKHVAQPPDPDLLMRQMDRSIAAVEYQRATSQLSKHRPPQSSKPSDNGKAMRVKDESVVLAKGSS